MDGEGGGTQHIAHRYEVTETPLGIEYTGSVHMRQSMTRTDNVKGNQPTNQTTKTFLNSTTGIPNSESQSELHGCDILMLPHFGDI